MRFIVFTCFLNICLADQNQIVHSEAEFTCTTNSEKNHYQNSNSHGHVCINGGCDFNICYLTLEYSGQTGKASTVAVVVLMWVLMDWVMRFFSSQSLIGAGVWSDPKEHGDSCWGHSYSLQLARSEEWGRNESGMTHGPLPHGISYKSHQHGTCGLQIHC